MSADSPAFVVASFLVQQAVFGDPETPPLLWPIFTGHLQDGDGVPDDAACVYDTTGLKDGRLERTGEIVEHFGLQLALRATDYEDGRRKIKAACDLLSVVAATPVTVDGTAYVLQNVSQQGTINFVGLEPGVKRRNRFTANFLLTFRLGTSEVRPVITPDRSAALVSGVAKTLLSVVVPAGKVRGGSIDLFVEVEDQGGESQGYSGRLCWVARNKAGVVSGSVVPMSQTPAEDGDGSLQVNAGYEVDSQNNFLITITVTTDLVNVTAMNAFYTPLGVY